MRPGESAESKAIHFGPPVLTQVSPKRPSIWGNLVNGESMKGLNQGGVRKASKYIKVIEDYLRPKSLRHWHAKPLVRTERDLHTGAPAQTPATNVGAPHLGEVGILMEAKDARRRHQGQATSAAGW